MPRRALLREHGLWVPACAGTTACYLTTATRCSLAKVLTRFNLGHPDPPQPRVVSARRSGESRAAGPSVQPAAPIAGADDPQRDAADQLRPAQLCGLGPGARLIKRRNVRAEHDDATEQDAQSRDQERRVEHYHTEQPDRDQHRRHPHDALGDQDKLAAALDRLGELLDLGLEPHDLLARIELFLIHNGLIHVYTRQGVYRITA